MMDGIILSRALTKMVASANMLLWITTYSSLCFGLFNSGETGFDPDKKSQSEIILNIGSRTELFVDDYLIDRLISSARLQLHNPEPEEIVITLDEPWEGNCSGYRSVFYDGIKYVMYYNSYDQKTQSTITRGTMKPSFCCYAESHDGIHWYKPILALYEFQGSKENNIVFINGLMGGIDADGGHPAVFRDENPNVEPDALYKAILRAKKPGGLFVFKSPDGIHWTPLSQKPVITDGAFDSQNLAFWHEEIGEYRAYWRIFNEEVRAIRTAKSRDFINWYDQKDLIYVDSPSEQLYTNQIKPYYRAPHILIGFPTRYVDRGWSVSMRTLPEPEDREWRSDKDSPREGTAVTESLFMASRDGILFKRWNEAFLRPGIERKGTWNYGHLYISWSVVETNSLLNGAPNELSFYVCENFRSTYASAAFRRYTLRIDGFVSVYAPISGGELITKPFTFKGKNLLLNFSSSAAGGINVEIQNEKGKAIPGYTLNDCPDIFGDTIERIVKWKGGSDLSSLQGKPVRLRFVLRDADLFSLTFK